MTDSKTEKRKPSPAGRAAFAGIVAGLAAGSVSYLFGTGLVGLVIGFAVGALVGSRTVLVMQRSREQTE